jgi:hypothetical protein
MATRFDCNRSAVSRLLVLCAALCVLLHIASGCAFSTRVQTPRSSDDLYLQRSIEVVLANRGARIARNAENAEYVLSCLVGAIGLDISGRFMGLQGSQGGFIPFTIPELALYKNTLRKGFAKTEIFLVDIETKKILHHSGPVEGAAYRRSKTYFFVFETRESDTTRLE